MVWGDTCITILFKFFEIRWPSYTALMIHITHEEKEEEEENEDGDR